MIYTSIRFITGLFKLCKLFQVYAKFASKNIFFSFLHHHAFLFAWHETRDNERDNALVYILYNLSYTKYKQKRYLLSHAMPCKTKCMVMQKAKKTLF